jgi:GMP synthase-like glutamine amidotransferase
MDVWETDTHPWLVDEKAAIRGGIANRNRPFFGVCLGSAPQALDGGGSCKRRRSRIRRCGTERIRLAHPMTRGLQPALRVMQWHHAE